jgi:hypothetical protein
MGVGRNPRFSPLTLVTQTDRYLLKPTDPDACRGIPGHKRTLWSLNGQGTL